MHRLRFALEFVGCAAVGALAGEALRHNDSLYWALFILGFGLCAGFLAHLVLGLRARWRFHYVTICRFYALALVGIVGYILFTGSANDADKKAAHAYFDQIKPMLEQYRKDDGQYPDALSQVPHLPPPPYGFEYHREKGSTSDPQDQYRIDYYSVECWSTGEWFDDD